MSTAYRTVPVTSGWFRDLALWPALGAELAALGRPVTAVSVGCSWGGECYSLTITAAEHGAEVTALGIDADPDMIAMAEANRWVAGVLVGHITVAAHAEAFVLTDDDPDRHIPRGSILRGHGERDVYAVRPELAERCRFVHGVVGADHRFGDVDLVLVRNVADQMGRDTARDLLARAMDALPPDGLLVIGHAEVGLTPPTARTAGYPLMFRRGTA